MCSSSLPGGWGLPMPSPAHAPPPPMPSWAKAGSLSQSLGPAGARPFLTACNPPERDTLQVSMYLHDSLTPKESVGLSKSDSMA